MTVREIAFCIDQKIDFIKEEEDDDDNHDSNDDLMLMMSQWMVFSHINTTTMIFIVLHCRTSYDVYNDGLHPVTFITMLHNFCSSTFVPVWIKDS